MSDLIDVPDEAGELDLSDDAAVQAGIKAAREMAFDWPCPVIPSQMRYECRECVAEVALTAALPALRAQIEADIRAKIADEIAALPTGVSGACHVAVSFFRAVDGLSGDARTEPVSHGMIPGSHERADGPECRCGAAWNRSTDSCTANRDARTDESEQP